MALADDRASIRIFTARPGSITTSGRAGLCYAIDGASQARIEPGIGEVSPTNALTSVRVAPPRTTTYQLTAAGRDGHQVRQQLVIVRQVETVQPSVEGCSEVKRGRSPESITDNADRPRSIAALSSASGFGTLIGSTQPPLGEGTLALARLSRQLFEPSQSTYPVNRIMKIAQRAGRIATLIVLILAAAPLGAEARQFVCWPIVRGDTAVSLARRLTGNAAAAYSESFQIGILRVGSYNEVQLRTSHARIGTPVSLVNSSERPPFGRYPTARSSVHRLQRDARVAGQYRRFADVVYGLDGLQGT